MIISAVLTNGSQHKIKYDKSKEDFMDLVKFNRDSFVEDTNGYYILVSNIAIFKVAEQGESNE